MPEGSRVLAVSQLVLSLLMTGSIGAQNANTSLAANADQFQTGKASRDGFDLYFRSAGTGDPVLILSGGRGDDCDYMLSVAAAGQSTTRPYFWSKEAPGVHCRRMLTQTRGTWPCCWKLMKRCAPI